MDECGLLEIVAKHRYDMDLKRIEKKRLLDHKAHILRNDNEQQSSYMLKLLDININILDLEMNKIGLEIDHFNEKISKLNKKWSSSVWNPQPVQARSSWQRLKPPRDGSVQRTSALQEWMTTQRRGTQGRGPSIAHGIARTWKRATRHGQASWAGISYGAIVLVSTRMWVPSRAGSIFRLIRALLTACLTSGMYGPTFQSWR